MPRLKRYQERTGTPITDVIRLAVEEFLDRQDTMIHNGHIRVAEGGREQAGVAWQSWQSSVATTAHGEPRSPSA
jgi:hypothetical protein